MAHALNILAYPTVTSPLPSGQLWPALRTYHTTTPAEREKSELESLTSARVPPHRRALTGQAIPIGRPLLIDNIFQLPN